MLNDQAPDCALPKAYIPRVEEFRYEIPDGLDIEDARALVSRNINWIVQERSKAVREGKTDVMSYDWEEGCIRPLVGNEIVDPDSLVNIVDQVAYDFLTEAFAYPNGIFLIIGRTRELGDPRSTSHLWFSLAKSLVQVEVEIPGFKESFISSVKAHEELAIPALMLLKFKDWFHQRVYSQKGSILEGYDLTPLKAMIAVCREEDASFKRAKWLGMRLSFNDKESKDLATRMKWFELPAEYDFVGFLASRIAEMQYIDHESKSNLVTTCLDFITGTYQGLNVKSAKDLPPIKLFIEILVEKVLTDITPEEKSRE